MRVRLIVIIATLIVRMVVELDVSGAVAAHVIRVVKVIQANTIQVEIALHVSIIVRVVQDNVVAPVQDRAMALHIQ